MTIQSKTTFIITASCLLILVSGLVFAQRRQPPRSADSSSNSEYDPENHHLVDGKLAETNLYELYRSQIRPADSQCLYSNSSNKAFVALVMKIDADYVVSEVNKEYKQVVENEVIPLIKKQCQYVDTIYVSNYIKGIRLERIDRRYDYAKEHSVGDSSFNGREFPLVNYLVQINNQGAVSYSRIGGAGSETSLTAIRKRYATELELEEKEKVEGARLRVEEARQAEINKQRAKEQNIANQRAKASNVLVLYKKGGNVNYYFSGYTQQSTLQNIYSGNFKPFTGGYEQSIINETAKAQASLLYARAPLDDILNENKRLTALLLHIAQIRTPIMIAYFAYHQAYQDQCSTNKEISWKDGGRRIDLIKMRGAIEAERIRGDVFYFSIREPFYDTFLKSLNAGNDELAVAILTGTPMSTKREFQSDFVKFLKTEGCASAKVRHFEVNLYLATEWLMSLQELLPPESLETQAIPVEKQQSQPEIQKANPTTKKTRIKPRSKNK